LFLLLQTNSSHEKQESKHMKCLFTCGRMNESCLCD